MVKVDISGAQGFFKEIPDYASAATAHRKLEEMKSTGTGFAGWLDLPERIAVQELKSITSTSDKIKKQSEALVVIGIGGSYLGARAAIDLLCSPDHNRLGKGPEVYFLGNSLSADALNDTLSILGEKDFSINVISKSGSTLESALAFRIFKGLLEKKYGKAGARSRIVATTDASQGVLKSIAETEGYTMLSVPDDVGGRYSVMSAVGLLPMAVAGIDINRMVSSASEEMRRLDLRSPENPAWQYAAVRQLLYRQGKSVEMLAFYEPSFRFMAEWWKQLFGESEGKNGIGLFPASVEFTADLHSMGQYIQDGSRIIFETVVSFEKSRTEYRVPFEIGNADGLNYLADRDYKDICQTVSEAVKAAHISGGVPNIGISVPSIDEESFASLVCFFELSCAISGYMSGVNPFDQPGVEAYKSGMFRLLGRDS